MTKKELEHRILVLEGKVSLISDLLAKAQPANDIPWQPLMRQCNHEYPTPWFGTIPPACTKCGQAFKQNYTITSAIGNSSTNIRFSR